MVIINFVTDLKILGVYLRFRESTFGFALDVSGKFSSPRNWKKGTLRITRRDSGGRSKGLKLCAREREREREGGIAVTRKGTRKGRREGKREGESSDQCINKKLIAFKRNWRRSFIIPQVIPPSRSFLDLPFRFPFLCPFCRHCRWRAYELLLVFCYETTPLRVKVTDAHVCALKIDRRDRRASSNFCFVLFRPTIQSPCVIYFV